MNTHQLITGSSLWIVDLDAKMVTRLPRTEAPVHTDLPYEKIGSPRPFVKVERMPHPRDHFYKFTTDEPRDYGDYWFTTGHVIEGELPLEEEEDG